MAAAGGAARGGTAYLNLESGSCHGDLEASTGALIAAGAHPCPFRKKAALKFTCVPFCICSSSFVTWACCQFRATQVRSIMPECPGVCRLVFVLS